MSKLDLGAAIQKTISAPRPHKPEPADDRAGDSNYSVDRNTVRQKPGRKRGPRQAQLHPKMLPEVADAIAAEADEQGITQGALIERMWAVYKKTGKK